MKFYKPQVQLVRKTILNQIPEYSIHAVTFCHRANFVADGFSTNDDELAEGKYKVTLNVQQDPNLPDFTYITPVVHVVSLGPIDFGGQEGVIEVQVEGGSLPDHAIPPGGGRSNGGSGTKSTVSTTDADTDTRPMGSGLMR